MKARYLIIFLLSASVSAQEFIHGPEYTLGYKKEVSVEGKWHFEIGDSLAYSKRGFDESAWNLIQVPCKIAVCFSNDFNDILVDFNACNPFMPVFPLPSSRPALSVVSS